MEYCRNCEQNIDPKKHFNYGILFVLLILGVIPGIIYYFFIGKKCPICNDDNWGDEKIEKQSKEDGRLLDILRERFAKGEITKEEFTTMKKEFEHDDDIEIARKEKGDFYECKSCNFQISTKSVIRKHCDDKSHEGYIFYKMD